MEEPLHKELIPGINATLSEDGTLTLSEVATVTIGDETVTMPTMAQVQLPAVACRALIKFLLRQASRDRIHYYKGQRHERKGSHED